MGVKYKAVLVTGGAGFIGSHVVEELLKRGQKAVVLDDLSTGKLDNLPVDSADVEFVHGSINDSDIVDELIKRCDSIIHLAAVASVQKSIVDPLGTHKVNCDGTITLLDSAKRNGVDRFVMASTAAVYGSGAVIPVSESDTPDPLTPYAIDKLTSERYLNFYNSSLGMKTTAFRLFNVYGPRQDPGSPYSGVISIFIKNALEGGNLTVYGDGSQTRDFVYVKDVARLFVESLGIETLIGQTVNVATGQSVSLNDLVLNMEKVIGNKLEVINEDFRTGDIVHSSANVNRLDKLYGAIPDITLESGLKSLVDYERKKRKSK